MEDLIRLPVVPVQDGVLFPEVTIPITVAGRGAYSAIQAAVKGDEKRIFVVLQREHARNATPDILHTFGTIATIKKVQQGTHRLQLLVHGDARAVAVRYMEDDGYLVAKVREVADMLPVDEDDNAFVAMKLETQERCRELVQNTDAPQALSNRVWDVNTSPGMLADLMGSYLEIETSEKQTLLETLPVEERLRRVLLHVQRQLAVLAAQYDIQSEVERELGSKQREMLLREQLKAIQKELGGDRAVEEVSELAERIEEANLPEDVAKEVQREFDRLLSMSAEGTEAQVIRTYLEVILELPWNARTEGGFDIKAAAETLESDHYGLADVKDRVLEFLSVLDLRQRRSSESEGRSHTPILLFAGPPGVGKTSIARSIASALGREYVRISLGGVSDESDIRGHRRTYIGAMPGRIVNALRKAGTKNPVILLDEIDKLGVSLQGDPASALLEVLDPAQNDSFVDHYLGVPFDLSEVMFVATANVLQTIPAPLFDRMELVEFSGYTEAEKLEIARRYLLPRQVEVNGLQETELTVSDTVIEHIISRYTRESGVRHLEKELGKLGRKVARRIVAAQDDGEVTVDVETLAEFLGRPRVHPEQVRERDEVGVASGLYYTPAGGDIMFVESTTMPGRGELVLTGQLGDVMKESARAVWSYAKSNAPELLIEESRFQRDVHVHVPAGAIPKDGPSAGVALAVSLVSTLSDVPVRRDVAMTGEITLSGRVLPIGGVKEKVLGAVRAGVREVILPRANEADLDDLPQSVLDDLKIQLVDTLEEALELALVGGVFRCNPDGTPATSVF